MSESESSMAVIESGTVQYSGGEKEEENRIRGVIMYGSYSSLFIARYPDAFLPSDNDLRLEELEGEPVPLEDIFPAYDSETFSKVPHPLPGNCFVKRARMLRYKHNGKRDDHISELIKHDALACEVFKRSPHPNIATYFGCQVENNRIVALIFKKYGETLHDRITRGCEELDSERCVKEVRMGIDHMHLLGYGHNDINPRNIMFDTDGRAVIIDFDSCRPLGQKLGTKSGTPGFYLKNARTSEAKNDEYGLRMIEQYLNDKATKL